VANSLEYFKQEKGFARLLKDMAVLFARHGRIYGAVRLLNPTGEEEFVLSQFFERDYMNQRLIRISLAEFERRFVKIFPGENMSFLFAEYQTPPKNIKEAFAEGISELLPKYAGTLAYEWLSSIASSMRRKYRPLMAQYAKDPKAVMALLDKVAEISSQLPVDITPLKEFSTKVLGESHALDFDTPHGALLLNALAFRSMIQPPANIEDSIGLYLKFGLLTLGTMCQVLVGSQVLTLDNIKQLSNVKSHGGKVFIIENAHVYAAVNDHLNGKKCTVISPINSHNPAFLYLLDKLAAEGCTLYYSGDMDYKGLLRADKLYVRYGKKFVPWRYDKTDYEYIIADSSTLLPDVRKDLAVQNEVFAQVLSHMRKTGKTGNSLPLVPLLVSDIVK